tara:strand:+ start:40 stop:387 length:348 start_codon:yes stop_codon:yes gene_type:complete
MIKKLNSNRFTKEKKLPDWYYDEGTSDFTKIDIQLYDIKFRLDDLKGRIFLYALRLRYAIAHEKSKQIKAELKLQEKMVQVNINKIEELQKVNAKARRENYDREYGEHDFSNPFI